AEALRVVQILGLELALVEPDELLPTLLRRIELGEELRGLRVARVFTQHAVVGAGRAFLVTLVLRVDARQTRARGHALARLLAAIGEALEHAGELVPAPGATIEVLEQAARAHVRGIEAHGLLEALDRVLHVDAAPRVANLHLGGAHQHRALVDVVARLLRFREVALHELWVAFAARLTLLDRAGRAGIVRTQLEKAQVADGRALVVIELFGEHARVRCDEIRLARRPLGGAHGEFEQPRDGVPFSAPGVFFAGGIEQTDELFFRKIPPVLRYFRVERRPRKLGIRIDLKFSKRPADLLGIHSSHPSNERSVRVRKRRVPVHTEGGGYAARLSVTSLANRGFSWACRGFRQSRWVAGPHPL